MPSLFIFAKKTPSLMKKGVTLCITIDKRKITIIHMEQFLA